MKQKTLLWISIGFSAADGNSLRFWFRCPESRDIVAKALKCRKVGNSTPHKATALPDLRKGTPLMSHRRRSHDQQEMFKLPENQTLVPALPAAGCVAPDKSPLLAGEFYLYLAIDQEEHSGALLASLCSGRPLSCRDGWKEGAWPASPLELSPVFRVVFYNWFSFI